MLLTGFDHVAVLTADTDRFVEFFTEVFGAEVVGEPEVPPGWRMTLVKVGPDSEFNLFEIADNAEAGRQTPMFGRGRLDHLGLRATSMDDFVTIRERLMKRGATDGFVTDFGPIFSVYFVGPDGLECEVCVPNPEAQPGVFNPPGTAARLFHTDGGSA